jgi:sigma-54 dependent transcriptional regulator, acetoin dehydrogenase operon transcriptional activator AcoR
MNVFTASDLEAADLLALARPGDDGAPPAVTPPPASDGRRRHAIRLAGTGGGVSRGVSLRPEVTDGIRLAQARERFLTAEPVEPGQVRDTILASWRRSREWHVAADRIDLSYVRDPDLDTPLTRTALPVLQSLREGLDGEPISVVLADGAGVVLSRLTADRDLERHLDGVQLAPGFSYAEETVGTNGIGTALESGQAAHVFGHEHYAEQLGDLADAAVPIRHPISGKAIGVVDLTCWRRDAGRLLITLAQSTAGQVTQALVDDSSTREVQLLQEYLRACRHTGGIVFALTSDLVLMNDFARDVLDPGDQAALLGHAAEALAGDHRGPVDVDLPTGARARMYCRPLRGQGQRCLVGGVVHVKLLELASRPAAGAGAGSQARRFGPGLVGSGPLWLRGCHQVEVACASGEWLSLAGEPGAGKLELLRVVHRRRYPAGTFHVLDAADAGDHDWMERALGELLEGEGGLAIRHVDRLSALRLQALGIALEQALAAGRQQVLWVAVTLSQGPAIGDLAGLRKFFPSAAELPPLRHHIEDLHKLVPFFLAKLCRQSPLTCSPEAMQLLLRSNWPGNTEQLWQVLRRVVQHRRTGTIHPADLPPECWSVSRRLLSPLESIQRDAIVQSLLDHQGNKAKGAHSLGMSRATIYRKIHEYGIITPAS